MAELAVDGLVHSELLFLKLPVLFLNPFVRRRTEWADAGETNAPAHPLSAPALA
jgi:hypothetical protein